MRDASGKWQQLTRFEDGIKSVKLGRDNAIYMLSRDKAPHGKLLRLSLDAPELSKAVDVVPEGKGVIQEFAPCDHGVYVSELLGGPSELLYFPKGNLKGKEIPILPTSSVAGLQSWNGDDLVFGNMSYVKPFAWFTFNPATNEVHRTALAMTSPVDFDEIEVVREFATSKDGTKVPLNILRKKGVKLDGNNPTLLTAYGGYSISLAPTFDSTRRIWFDAGGVYVRAACGAR